MKLLRGAQNERGFFRWLILPNFLSFNRPHTRLKIPVRRPADKGSAELQRKEPKLHLVLTACGRSSVRVFATSSCLFSSCTLDNWYWEHAPRPATMKTLCIRLCFRLFVVESTQRNSRIGSVCSNLSAEISCADIAVAWSLPPACDEK